jgi:hypothetical protein
MANNDVLREQGTAITWKDPAFGTAFKDLTLANLASSAGRMGEFADLGAKFAPRFAVEMCIVNATAAPTAGRIVELYWAASTGTSTFPGQATGADAAYPATVANNKLQLQLIGFFVCANTTSNAAQNQTLEFSPPSRYGCPVVVNMTDQALNTLAGTDSGHYITLTPVNDEVA